MNIVYKYICKTNMEKQYSEKYKIKHFDILQSTFWDSPEKIKQNYDSLMKILEENNKNPPNERKNFPITLESLKESYSFLTNEEQRQNYLTFLRYYYFLSEPLTLDQLKRNFNNKLFPFYLFTIKIKEKQQISTIIIDFVEKKLTIFYKEKEFYSIKSDNIMNVDKKNDSKIVIKSKNENYDPKKNKPKDEFKEITFEPEINQQIDMIYTVICYFAKKIDDNNSYDLLEDDSYRPFGIILRSKIIKDHRVKVFGKDDRYAILGSSMIIIYKNEEMNDIRNVLPLHPFFMNYTTLEKERKIIFKYPMREQGLSFYTQENYEMWINALDDIFNKRIQSKMEISEIFQANENKNKEKIIKEIEVEILCVNKEIEETKKKLDTTK